MKKDNVIDQNLYLSLLLTSPVPGRLYFSNQTHILSEPPKPHGFYHCHRHNCTTCSHSVESTAFYAHHTGTSHNIQGHITYNTSNVIYIITCTKCNKQYIGETGRKLKTRISELLRNIVKNQNTVIGTHFYSANHKSNHMQINPIEALSNSIEYRKVEELFWIKKNCKLQFGLTKKDHI